MSKEHTKRHPTVGAGIDGTPDWAYDEDGYCVSCGNGSWKYHMPDCELRDGLDIARHAIVIIPVPSEEE